MSRRASHSSGTAPYEHQLVLLRRESGLSGGAARPRLRWPAPRRGSFFGESPPKAERHAPASERQQAAGASAVSDSQPRSDPIRGYFWRDQLMPLVKLSALLAAYLDASFPSLGVASSARRCSPVSRCRGEPRGRIFQAASRAGMLSAKWWPSPAVTSRTRSFRIS
jgi:hypothetical protein